jgi:hypothetical protein
VTAIPHVTTVTHDANATLAAVKANAALKHPKPLFDDFSKLLFDEKKWGL